MTRTGASTPEGDVRVFAGLRSDPFYLAWDIAALKKLPNLLQHTNVLCVVVELDTRRVLDPAKGSLFGAIAETVPISQQRTLLGPPVLRIDWVGRPEQTNMRLNNPAMSGIDDLRDLWNQQTPFAISKELQPLFLQRLKDSLATWDMLDGKADWTPEALAANANVFLDDFLLFDVAKPITDDSHLEIEKSTIERPSLPDGRRPHGRCELDRHPAHLAGQSRSRVSPGRRHRGDEARYEGISVFRDSEHGAADRRPIHRARGNARRGMVVDRRLRRRLASPDCENQRDRHRNRAAPHHRNARWPEKSSNDSRRSTT